MKVTMKKRSTISLKCPICLIERVVRKDGAGKLCRRCRSKENSKNKIGKYFDLSGLRSGRLSIISVSHKIKNHYWWLCKCDCGNEVIISGMRLKSKKTKSCGCIAKKQNGLSQSSTYRTYKAMLQRCYDSKVPHYKRYGAKGIKVCDRWLDSFFNFLQDMGSRPENCTLDRIDNKGDYNPTNCRWATLKKQANNRAGNHIISAFGQKMTLTEWAEKMKINWFTLRKRIITGLPIEIALTKKVRKICQRIKKI